MILFLALSSDYVIVCCALFKCRGAGFGAALVLTHLQHYHDPSDNTKSIFQTFTFYTDGVAYFPYYVRPFMNLDENWQFYERKRGF